MIDTSKNIKETINYLVKETENNLNEDFIYQEQYFLSDDHNFTFNNIESHLNDLYERTRMLQDVISYAKTYVKDRVRIISNECKSILDNIEDSVDSLKNNAYISIEVPFEESSGSYRDRSGTLLPRAAVQASKLTLSHEVKKEVSISSITKTRGFVAYRSNLEDLKYDKAYRAFYMQDATVKDGLIEEITVEFPQEEIINYVSIIPSNCEVVSVEYVNAAGTVDHLQDYKDLLHRPRKVKRVIFSIKCKVYDTKTYYIDESRLKSNFWSTVKEYSYNQAIGLSSSISAAELDELAGLNQFRKDYESYVSAVEDWLKRREEVVKTNISNGYTDSVPTVDLVVPPEMLMSKKLNNANENVKAKESLLKSAQISNEVNPANYLPASEYRNFSSEAIGYTRTGEKINTYLSQKDLPDDLYYKTANETTTIEAAALREKANNAYKTYQDL